MSIVVQCAWGEDFILVVMLSNPIRSLNIADLCLGCGLGYKRVVVDMIR
jgi:hypothetical protein